MFPAATGPQWLAPVSGAAQHSGGPGRPQLWWVTPRRALQQGCLCVARVPSGALLQLGPWGLWALLGTCRCRGPRCTWRGGQLPTPPGCEVLLELEGMSVGGGALWGEQWVGASGVWVWPVVLASLGRGNVLLG